MLQLPPNAPFVSLWTEVHGLRMHAKASGGERREPVVLVHGLGLSHRYMMPLAVRLAAEFRVYVPDLPGFGDSAHPRKILDVPELADALAAWMDAIGLERAALLGNSQGCQIIADLAARYPGRMTRGVLQGPTTPPEERGWLRQFIRWRQNAPYNPPELGPISYGDYHRAGYLRAIWTFYLSLKDRMEDKLPRIAVPVLVVRGQCDPICRPAWAAGVARLLPQGRLVAIPGVAHTLVFTAPDQLAAVATQFLRQNA